MKKTTLSVLTLISLILSHSIVAMDQKQSLSDKAKGLWNKAKASSPFNKSAAADADREKPRAVELFKEEIAKMASASTQAEISRIAVAAESYASFAYGRGSNDFGKALDIINNNRGIAMERIKAYKRVETSKPTVTFQRGHRPPHMQ